MYLVGLDHRSRTLYSTITVMISLPATIKIFSWILSSINGALIFNHLTFITYMYVLFFLVSGLTGMWLSHIVLNITMHDTFYVIAHFHLMLSATAMLGLFLGVYYYFPTIFGVRLVTPFVWLHIIFYSVGHLVTFFPQFFLGTSGMPRRIHDYPDMFTGWNSLSSSGYFFTLIGILSFFIAIVDSHAKSRLAPVFSGGLVRTNSAWAHIQGRLIYTLA